MKRLCSYDLEADGVVGRFLRGEHYAEGVLVLREFQVAAVAEKGDGADFADFVLAAEGERGDDGFAVGPAHHEGVERGVPGGEADVGSREVFAGALVEAEILGFGGSRDVAGDLPRTGLIQDCPLVCTVSPETSTAGFELVRLKYWGGGTLAPIW